MGAVIPRILRSRSVLLPVLAWLGLLAGAQSAAAIGNVTYHSGPLSHSMTGVLVDWGPRINPVYTDPAAGDPGLIKYLAANSGSTADIGGVLAQYMDNTGHNAANAVTYGQHYQITPSAANNGTTVTDSQISSELVSQIQSGALPSPSGDGLQTTYLVLFPSGMTECMDDAQTQCSGTSICAYHGNTALPDGTNVLYAVLPDNMSGAMTQGCGNASTLFADQTSFLSHEWSETITDPTGYGWWNTRSTNEIGDNCNGQTSANGPWTVQLEWSNRDRACLAAASAYSAPTASFVAPGLAPPAQQVSFNASSSTDPGADTTSIGGTSYSIPSGIASYQWSWGDGSSSAASVSAIAGHTYASTGTYQVSLTVTDRLGFKSTVTHPVSISTSATPSPVPSTNVASSVSDIGATLNGTVNPEGQPVQYQFAYGTSPGSLTQTTGLTPGPTGQTDTPVSATLSGLQPATTYYFQLEVLAGGQTYTGGVQTFTTNASPPPAQTPTVATGAAGQITATSALLTGTINPGGSRAVSYHFAYGTSPGSLTATTREAYGLAGTSAVPVSASAGGLSPRTTYYFQLDATLDGHVYQGTVASFTTPTPAPGALTGAPIRITSSTATVLGLVFPNGVATSYHVEYGTTTAYGHSTAPVSAGSGNFGVPVGITLAGLAPRTIYHYRVVATSAGGTAVGSDRSFLTGRALRHPPRFGLHFRSHARIGTARRGRVTVRFSCSTGCTAHFSVTVAAAGSDRSTPVALMLARGTGWIRAKGSGTAALTFIPALRNQLRRYRSLKLLVSGYAVSRGSAPSAPLTSELTLT